MNRRIVLATVLSMLILVGWMMLAPVLFPPPPRPAAPPGPPPADEEPKWAEIKKPAPEARPAPEFRAEPQENIVLESDILSATFTNRGAGLKALSLKYPTPDKRVELLKELDPTRPHLSLVVPDEPGTLDYWQAKVERNPDGTGKVVFSRPLRGGLELEKEFSLKPGKREIGMTIRAVNRGAEAKLNAELVAFTGMQHDSDYRYESYAQGFAIVTARGVYALKYSNVTEAAKTPTTFKAGDLEQGALFDTVGLRNRYFAVALLSASDDTRAALGSVVFSVPKSRQKIDSKELPLLGASANLRELTVKDQKLLEFSLFVGPLEGEVLEKAGRNLSELHSYTGCGPLNPFIRMVAPVLLWIMNAWNALVGNYGVAIILTTLVVRLCMFPLSRKSLISMSKMSELSPKVQLIRERYKDNPQKQQQETMKLWKEHGASPFGGCLPVLVQLPIWIGMYSVIDMSIELRQAPFMLWIKDLSEPDRLVHFQREFSVLIGTIGDINVLPVIMTITWFLQSYFAPRSPDPQMATQQKMFLFMPIVFGLVCYTYASGLSLYFFVNSLLSMAEQKIIRKIWIPPKKTTA